MHGVLVAALAVGGALLNLTLFASSQQRLAATAGVLVLGARCIRRPCWSVAHAVGRYPATARSTFDHGRSRHLGLHRARPRRRIALFRGYRVGAGRIRQLGRSS